MALRAPLAFAQCAQGGSSRHGWVPITPPMRALSRLLAGALVAGTLVAGTLVALSSTSAASPTGTVALSSTPAEDEYGFLQKINVDRTRAGLKPLVSDSKLASTSRTWSGKMAAAGKISHDPALATIAAYVEPDWQRIGENVGVGYSVTTLHDAFMNSAPHKANVMSSAYNRVGIGVVHSAGKVWVTVRFLQGPAISGPTGLETKPEAPVAILTGDFDADGFDDAFVYGPGTKVDELWFGDSDTSMVKHAASVSGKYYRPVAADFDGDGGTDILWYAPGTASDVIWSWDGSGWTSRSVDVDGTFTPLAGDYDGDGYDDVLWYAPGKAGDVFWFGSSSGSFTSKGTTVSGSYRPRTGDFDGNGSTDVLWYAPGDAADSIWYMGDTRGSYSGHSMKVQGTYRPVVGDFDATGTDDVLWYAPGSTTDVLWRMSTARGAFSRSYKTVNGTYVPGAGDVDSNTADDIIWFSPSSASGDPLWYQSPGAATSPDNVG